MSLVYPDERYRAEVSAFMQELDRGFRELVCQAKDGRRVPIEWANVELTDRTRLGIGVDVTRRNQYEEQLRAVNLELKQADRRKNEFLGVLSHELRNPLAPIRYSLGIIESVPPGSEAASRALRVIDRQTTHLTDLVNDLLDVTRITRNKIRIQKQRVDLVEVMRRTADDNRSLFDARDVKLALTLPSSPIPVLADPTRLAQVIGNLLHNAAKFGQQSGHVEASAAIEGDAVCVRIVDDGIGIAPETLPRLFEPFVQADQGLDRGKGGLGLGLALSKLLVELHGGSISAHSEGDGMGAEFRLRLPLDGGPLVQPAASIHGMPAPQRILVIEDLLDAAESLRLALERDGHEVTIASDGPRGLEAARAFAPEVVFCDIGLPGMDGYEVAQRLRDGDRSQRPFLVALSGYALPEDIERAAAAGFDRHLAKPPDFAEIRQLLFERKPA
jgi:two-component system CheB/CheR fusion protein